MELAMNTTIHPCVDFYEFSCGNYDEAINVSPFLYNLEDKYQTFEHNRFDFTTKSGNKAGLFFESMESNANDSFYKSTIEEGDDVKQKPFQNFENLFIEYEPLLNLVGSWPYSPTEWDDKLINWLQFTADLCSAGIITYIQCVYAKNALLIEPITIQIRPRRKVEKFMEKFGASTMHSRTASWEIYNFSLKLYNLNFDRNNSNNITTRIMNSTAENFNWKIDFIEYTHEQLNVSSNHDRIKTHFASRQLLDEIMDLIESYDKRIVVNYLVWKLIEHIQEESYSSFLNYFESAIHFEYLLKLQREDAIEPALNRFLMVTRRFQKIHQQNIEKKILKYIAKKMHEEIVDEDYESLQIDPMSYFKNLLNAKKNCNRNMILGNIIDLEDQPNHPLYYFKLFMEFVILVEQRPILHYFITSSYNLWLNERKSSIKDDFLEAKSFMDQENNSETKNVTDKDLNHLLPIFAAIEAFRESVEDYQLWYKSEVFYFMENYFLQFYGLTPDNILFVTFAQLHCGRGGTHKSRINTMFKAMDSFTNEFHCFTN